jgi:hypothetical protein
MAGYLPKPRRRPRRGFCLPTGRRGALWSRERVLSEVRSPSEASRRGSSGGVGSDLDEVAAGVVKHRRCHWAQGERFLGEDHALSR